MNKNYPVEGLKELQAYLTALPKNLQRNAVSAGLRAAAKVVQEEAKLLAPKESGALAKSIKLSTPRKEAEGVHSLRLRLKGRHAFLGWFHEYGVLPHRITVSDETLAEVNGRLKPLQNGKQRSRRTLMKHANRMEREGSLVIGGKFVGPSVMHPGMSARPFMRPALDHKAQEAVQAMATSIRAYIAGVKDKTGYDATAGMDED